MNFRERVTRCKTHQAHARLKRDFRFSEENTYNRSSSSRGSTPRFVPSSTSLVSVILFLFLFSSPRSILQRPRSTFECILCVVHFEVGKSGGTFAPPRAPHCDTNTESTPRSLVFHRTRTILPCARRGDLFSLPVEKRVVASGESTRPRGSGEGFYEFESDRRSEIFKAETLEDSSVARGIGRANELSSESSH